MRVAFESTSDFFGQGIPSGHEEIWLYDTETKTLTRLMTVPDDGVSWDPSISAEGKTVAFESNSELLGGGIPGWQLEIWLQRSFEHRRYLPLVVRRSA
jgi:Tol biopolymer transport system component